MKKNRVCVLDACTPPPRSPICWAFALWQPVWVGLMFFADEIKTRHRPTEVLVPREGVVPEMAAEGPH